MSARILLCLVSFGLAALGRAAEPAATVDTLAWLAGTWRFERNGRTVTERWTAPAGGMMLGTSHTVAGAKTVEYEFVVIRAGGDGRLVYSARPSGQAEATFTLVRADAREVVFENLAHDFPQRISYTLRADGTLLAAIEGSKNGKTRRVEFPYRRAE
jgi:hypothetical protein